MHWYTNSYDLWAEYHKVTFDGDLKRIIINNGENLIDVKTDLYSSWKEWVTFRDNAKYESAFRTIGGDPIDINAGIYAGDIYFLINGWQIIVPHAVNFTGVIYHDDGIDPFIILDGAGVRSTVSQLVQTVVVKEVIVAPGPSASQIASQVRLELTPELDKINSQINGLTPSQATMLQEIYTLYGLDPTKPLVVTNTQRSSGTIHQTITSTQNQTTVTRV